MQVPGKHFKMDRSTKVALIQSQLLPTPSAEVLELRKKAKRQVPLRHLLIDAQLEAAEVSKMSIAAVKKKFGAEE